MPRLVELLHTPRRVGYPADYLLARLASRRAVRRASCPAGNGAEAWRELDRELDWLYGQLESPLRRALAPVLLFIELPRLLVALRFSAAGDPNGAQASLRSSRLAEPVRKIFARALSFPAILRELSDLLAGFEPTLAGLARAWDERGWSGLERSLVDGLLAAARREQATGPVRAFLDQLSDRQELLRLAKAERWQRPVPGFDRPASRHRRQRILAGSGPGAAGDPGGLDRLLLREMAGEWQRRGRIGGGLERLLDYLWTCQLAARDCGVRGLESLLGEGRVKEETIL